MTELLELFFPLGSPSLLVFSPVTKVKKEERHLRNTDNARVIGMTLALCSNHY